MPNKRKNTVLDLRPSEQEKLTPLLRYVGLLLHQLINASAERAELSLEESPPEAGFQIHFSVQGDRRYMAPPPRHLYKPVVNILCNYASVPYYAKGLVEGEFETAHPASSWLLQSKDLQKCLVLSRTQQIKAGQTL